MAKIYTAHEMRVRANLESNVWGDKTTADMLLQAANLIEREAKREKKYEYSVKTANGTIYAVHVSNNNIARAYEDDPSCVIVRREVGEWEEVK